MDLALLSNVFLQGDPWNRPVLFPTAACSRCWHRRPTACAAWRTVGGPSLHLRRGVRKVRKVRRKSMWTVLGELQCKHLNDPASPVCVVDRWHERWLITRRCCVHTVFSSPRFHRDLAEVAWAIGRNPTGTSLRSRHEGSVSRGRDGNTKLIWEMDFACCCYIQVTGLKMAVMMFTLERSLQSLKVEATGSHHLLTYLNTP